MESSDTIETDYLVVGAGATSMAFVDTLLSENADARVAMVDRKDRPGGHWNDAYPFVRLHQPSPWYGVASRALEQGDVDRVGINAGMSSLASGAEVVSYFDTVMRTRFLPSGRVRFLPMSEYRRDDDGSHTALSMTSGARRRIVVRSQLVDATHARTEVPATHPPRYAVDPGVQCVPLNALPGIARPYTAYTVVGSGKTGIDACLWLLDNGVAPERIRWIRPRDAWYLDRGHMQPGIENFEHYMRYVAAQLDSIAEAATWPALLARLEADGLLVRMDPSVEPSTFRCATISQGELAALRKVADVVRLGHVRHVQATRLVLDQGTVPAHPDTLYVDCSARAFGSAPDLPVFDGDRINLLTVRWCQPLFSAALIAYVESHFSDPARMNELCAVVPNPEYPVDWLRMWAVTLSNMAHWRAEPAVNAWLMQCRLNINAVMMRGVDPKDEDRMALVRALGVKSQAAAKALPALLSTLERGARVPA
jgi:hypothetical protein